MMKYKLTTGVHEAIVTYGDFPLVTATYGYYDGTYTAILEAVPSARSIGPGSGQGTNAREAVADAIASYGLMMVQMAEELREQPF